MINYEGYITKKQSKMIYGIAILLMVFHHMFGFPYRIHYDWTGIYYYKEVPIEVILAAFGRVCIAMYAYISGYGMIKKTSVNRTDKKRNIINNYQYMIKQLGKFYSHYWLVFFIFVPLGFLLYGYEYNSVEFIKNLFGLLSTYNAEWWYVRQYMCMLLVFPIIEYVIKYLDQLKLKGFIYLLIYISSILALNCIENNGFWIYLLCFVEGMLISFYRLDNIIFKLKAKIGKIIDVVAGVNIVVVIVLRLKVVGGKYDWILAPIFIYGCLVILNESWMPQIINKLLSVLGQYSIYIWLIHTFFIYYYFQKIVFSFHVSVIIYVVTLIGLVLVSIILEKLRRKILKLE